MTIVRVGSTEKYAEGWDKAFSRGRSAKATVPTKSAKKAAPKKAAAKKASPKKAKKKG